MKILLCSHPFAPSIGGLETVSALLASAFVDNGAKVIVVTQTPSGRNLDLPYPLHRRPSPIRLIKLVKWADVVFHCNIGLRTAWPLLLHRRPWIVGHHVWIPDNFPGKIKRRALRHAHGISVSRAIRAHIDTPSLIIPNPYDDTLYRRYAEIEKDCDLVFLGRLEQYKGTRLLLDALVQLEANTGLRPSLTFIGDGPERQLLEAIVTRLGLGTRVDFTGALPSQALAPILNRARILVVPSVWDEPFGVVALEGIACGCAIIGSSRAGLPEAIGPCGLTFPNSSVEGLAACLGQLIPNPSYRDTLLQHAPKHLARHRPTTVARQYLALFQKILDTDSTATVHTESKP